MNMKVMIVHNSYQVSGGEDAVFENEMKALAEKAKVISVEIDNNSISGFFSKIVVATEAVFSFRMYFRFKRLLKKNRPDIVHVHNYFPRISPAIFYAANNLGIPIVHTLHNFRAICPTATLSLDGQIVDRSIHTSSIWTVPARVYRKSIVGTSFLVLMVEFHKFVGTWRKQVDGYIALTEFSRDIYVKAGWPREKIFVKPNFCVDPGECTNTRERYALYIGRLSEEKGITFILDSFTESKLPLKIAGDGPLQDSVVNRSEGAIEYLGSLDSSSVSHHMSRASCLVMASTWYEGFPMVIVEALAHGLPVVVPNLGNMAAVVKDGVTGLHYDPKNVDSFKDTVGRILGDISFRDHLSSNARQEYLELYSESKNREQLLSIYQKVIDVHAKARAE